MLTLTYYTISLTFILPLEADKGQTQGQENLITRYKRMWQSENCDVCANILYWRIYYMDKYIFDESNGLWYELQGDYYIPCLILSEEEHSLSVCGDSATSSI